MQVVDRKGWKATYPKVIMSTPYQDSMYTEGAGTELQNVLEHSPCVGSERERQSVEGLPGTFIYKTCTRIVVQHMHRVLSSL